MALPEFTPERVQVTHKGEALLNVRGLNLDDVSLLVRTHMDDLRQLAELWNGAQDEIFSNLMRDGFMVRLVSEVPSVACTIIAVAADEPSGVETIRTYPLGVQVKAMTEIVRMTLEDFGGPKEFAALFQGMTTKQLQTSAA